MPEEAERVLRDIELALKKARENIHYNLGFLRGYKEGIERTRQLCESTERAAEQALATINHVLGEFSTEEKKDA